MSPPRAQRTAVQLRDSYNETLDALRRRFEQLEAAVAQFAPDLDEQALSAAWHSEDPLERNRADNVLSSFEKTYMLLMDLVTLSVKRYRATTLYRDQWLRWFSNFLEILLEALRPGKPVRTQPDGGAVSRLTLGCSPRPSVSSQAQRTFDGEMSIRAALASIVTSAALRAASSVGCSA